MYTTLIEAFWYVVDLLRKNPKSRKIIFVVSTIVFVLLGLALGIHQFGFFQSLNKDTFQQLSAILAFITGVGFTASVAAYLPAESIPPFLYRQQAHELSQERAKIKERIARKQKTDLFDAVQLSLNEIREYCVLNKRQAWSSFAFGAFCILLGLGVLLYGVSLFYDAASPNITVASLASVSGILIQFIGGTCLFLYRTTLRQGNFYFAHLVQMQDMMLAIKLCSETTDASIRPALQGKIIETLLNRTARLPPVPSGKET